MNTLKKLFYPTGNYNKKYLRYVTWSLTSNILASTQQVLVTHNMLLGINACDSDTTRTLNYIGKDIIGQIGSLAYMVKMAENADKNPRKFLAYSNLFQQSSYMVVYVTPMLCTDWFLPVAGTANIMSNISFAGFGAINAKCITTLAEGDNVGEIYAKLAVINTLGSSIGMLLGLGIVGLIPDTYSRLCLIPVLGILRIFTLNKAIKGLV